MRFTDRFRRAAEAARSTLQNPGLLGGETAIRGTQEIGRDDPDIDVGWRVRVLGAPDPFSLITKDEVVALTGLPVGGPTLTYADDDLGVRFDAVDGRDQMWSFGVHAGHAAEEGRSFDPVSWFQWMVALLDAADAVDGLGDAAVYQSGVLYVRGEGQAFYVLIQAPEGSPVEQWAKAIARRVLERFASGEAR